MKSKRLFVKMQAFLLTLCMVFTFADISAYAEEDYIDSVPDGYEVYDIDSVEDFMAFEQECRQGADTQYMYVSLNTDLDLSEESDFIGIESFAGIFEGNDHMISGAILTGQTGAIGFFKYVEETATIENLEVEIKIVSNDSSNYVGAIAGVNGGNIRYCNAYGELAGIGPTGGIAGVNGASGQINGCANYGTVNSLKTVGGIAGENRNVITGCLNEGYVNANSDWLDYEDDATFTLSVSGVINYITEAAESQTDIGGIAGFSKGSIYACENDGIVGYPHYGTNVGGIAGRFTGKIYSCINEGKVYGKNDVGGIAGQFEPQLLGDGNDAVGSAVSNIQKTSSNLPDNLSASVSQLTDVDEDTDPDDIDVDHIMLNLDDKLEEAAENDDDATSELADNIDALTDQVSDLYGALSDRKENLKKIAQGESVIQDYSALLPDNEKASRINGSVNEGYVNGDRNVGGIAGNMGIEGMDSDDSSLQEYNDNYMTVAVLEYCKNLGIIEVKKENAGGMVGYGEFGYVRYCTDAGRIKGEDANYIGGIAGQYEGTVGSCYSLTVMNGNNYIGGIAGKARRVRRCCSMPVIIEAAGWSGAILGDILTTYEDDDASVVHSKMTESIYKNYYVSDTLYGIAGASYKAAAYPITYEKLLEKESLPSEFSNLFAKFIDDDNNVIATRYIYYDEPVADIEYPDYDTDEDEYVTWTGFYSEKVSGNIFLFTDNEDVVKILSSSLTSEDGKPIALVSGRFTGMSSLVFEDITDVLTGGMDQDARATETVYKLQVNGIYETGDGTLKLRMYDSKPERVTTFYYSDGKNWKRLKAEQIGSYYEMTLTGSEAAILVKTQPESYLQTMIIATSVAALILLVLILLIYRKYGMRKEKDNEHSKTDQTGEQDDIDSEG